LFLFDLAAPQQLPASLVTNPFVTPDTVTSSVFSPPVVTSSTQFISANPVSVATYPDGVYAPYVGGSGVPAQPGVYPGAVWNSSELFRPYGGQQAAALNSSAANPFLVSPYQCLLLTFGCLTF